MTRIPRASAAGRRRRCGSCAACPAGPPPRHRSRGLAVPVQNDRRAARQDDDHLLDARMAVSGRAVTRIRPLLHEAQLLCPRRPRDPQESPDSGPPFLDGLPVGPDNGHAGVARWRGPAADRSRDRPGRAASGNAILRPSGRNDRKALMRERLVDDQPEIAGLTTRHAGCRGCSPGRTPRGRPTVSRGSCWRVRSGSSSSRAPSHPRRADPAAGTPRSDRAGPGTRRADRRRPSDGTPGRAAAPCASRKEAKGTALRRDVDSAIQTTRAPKRSKGCRFESWCHGVRSPPVCAGCLART